MKRLFTIFALLWCLACMALGSTSATFTFSDATTITWTWTEDRQIGQYVTGDWWVVGPITLTSVTRPAGVANRDGSMLGMKGTGVFSPADWDGLPGEGSAGGLQAEYNSQGLHYIDGHNIAYDAALNIANFLPYAVPVNESVWSGISIADGLYNPATNVDPLTHAAVLTVVASAPAADSFRPFIGGTDKVSYFTKADIDYTKMLNLTGLTLQSDLTTALADVAEGWRYPLMNFGSGYHSGFFVLGRFNTPDNASGYGANFANASTGAFITLSRAASNAQKEAAAISFIQQGIDIYGFIRAGGGYPSSGGHAAGRKPILFFTAYALNSAAMKAALRDGYSASAFIATGVADDAPNETHYTRQFAEDRGLFIVTQNDIDQNAGRIALSAQGIPNVAFPSGHKGSPEWTPGDSWQPALDNQRRTASYAWGRLYRFNYQARFCTTAVLASLYDQGRATWNHEPFFRYQFERVRVIESRNEPWNAGRYNIGQTPPDDTPLLTAAEQQIVDLYYTEGGGGGGSFGVGTANFPVLNIGN
jgi:hypothetical protein